MLVRCKPVIVAKCRRGFPLQTVTMMSSSRSQPQRWLPALLWTLAATVASAGSGGIVDTSHSPQAKYLPIRLDEVRWTRGFWADRFATVRDRSVPGMWELMRGSKYKPFYEHFLIAAGKMDGDYHGAAWNDGDFYKWVEAASAVYAVSRDPELKTRLDQATEAIVAAQRDDGYIHTPVLIGQRNGVPGVQPFQDRFAFEMYNMGHLMTAACIHQRTTGENRLLEAGKKAADFLVRRFQHPTPELAKNSVCPSHYMGIVELYRVTGDERYLELAKTFLEMRALVVDGGDDNQDRIPFAEQDQAAGHAVRANYLYAGAADLYLETGDDQLWRPLAAVWRNVVRRKMYITGACGALFDGASPDGAVDQAHISRVHQAYGRNYQLPSITAHNETCANIGNVMWNWRMFLATGDARFVDIMELALYNSVLSGISLDGVNYFYVNPLRQVEPLPTELRWPRTRVPFLVSFCCPPNVVRTIAEVHGYAYSKTVDTIAVNLYGSSQLSTALAGGPLQLTQTTDYPWTGDINVRVDECPADPFAVSWRIPGWASEASVRVNGEVVGERLSPGTYFDVRRSWKAGDTVELRLPMPAELIEAHPLVEETRNQVAVRRGPIVYCLESVDLPVDVRLQDVAIPATAELLPTHDAGLLQGVTRIHLKGLAEPTGDWSNVLYRPLQQGAARTIDIPLIPYYAWSNRGPSEMSVWLPLK